MKKFLCYDTNDAASGKINVSSNGVLKPNSTVPSTNGAANQQLVTDGSGNTKWEDRLAYESFNPLIEQVTVSCTTALTEIKGYTGDSYYTFASMRESDTASSTFEIIYDGTRYIVERHSGHIAIDSYNFDQYVGDPYLKEYPFAIEFNYEHNTVFTKTSGEHTFVVNASSVKQIDQNLIPPQTVYVNATGGNDENGDGSLITNVTLDKTYDEIYALLKRGVDVKIIRENLILNYLSSQEGEKGVIIFSAYLSLDEQVTVTCGIRNDNIAIVQTSNLTDSFLSIDDHGVLIAPLILKSGTPGSSKKFKITVDDSGTISATEV